MRCERTDCFEGWFWQEEVRPDISRGLDYPRTGRTLIIFAERVMYFFAIAIVAQEPVKGAVRCIYNVRVAQFD